MIYYLVIEIFYCNNYPIHPYIGILPRFGTPCGPPRHVYVGSMGGGESYANIFFKERGRSASLGTLHCQKNVLLVPTLDVLQLVSSLVILPSPGVRSRSASGPKARTPTRSQSQHLPQRYYLDLPPVNPLSIRHYKSWNLCMK